MKHNNVILGIILSASIIGAVTLAVAAFGPTAYDSLTLAGAAVGGIFIGMIMGLLVGRRR